MAKGPRPRVLRTLEPPRRRRGEVFRIRYQFRKGLSQLWVQLGTYRGKVFTVRWERPFENEVCAVTWTGLYLACQGDPLSAWSGHLRAVKERE